MMKFKRLVCEINLYIGNNRFLKDTYHLNIRFFNNDILFECY